MIEFESVGRTYRDGTADVVDLTLQVPPGRITVVLGPSGGGATTALRMVNRLVEPSAGRILWDGTPLRSRRRTALRREMGYVTRHGGLFPHRTVLDNVGAVPALLGWSRSRTQRRTLELLDLVGLDADLASRYPDQLRGSQPQRVALARALAADPPVLLLEEPFADADPGARRELQALLVDLQRQLGKTVVLVTDDGDEALLLGDQVAVLRVDGRLAQVGPPQELLEHPVDAHVEGLLGRDRGFRSLTYLPAASLGLSAVPVVRNLGSAAVSGPTLVVDQDARPLGWADGSRPQGMSPLGATFDVEHGTLRHALDAALTSPYGLAVAVTASSGRYAGVATAAAILASVGGARSERARESAAAAVPAVTTDLADESLPAADPGPAPAAAGGGDAGDGDVDPVAPHLSSDQRHQEDRPDPSEDDRDLMRELDAADARG